MCAIYGIYVMGWLCASLCVIEHIFASSFPEEFCHLGLGVCVVFYAGQKGFLYTFFLDRAKLTKGIVNVVPDWVYNILLPVFIGRL